MKRKWFIAISIVLVFFLGILSYHFWLTSTQTSAPSTGKKRKILYWVAPMDSNYRRDKPGKSPMGMDLVPVYENAKNNDKDVVKISPVVENNLGVKTEKLVRRNLSRIITSVGYVRVNENQISHIHTYIDGWVKVLTVKSMGEFVKKGQLLFEFYSPTLVNAQEELLLALRNHNNLLIHASKKKLLTLGMPQSQINRLVQTHKVFENVKVFATQAGIISKLNVREGKYVKPETEIMTIENLDKIWIIAEVFERQTSWVKGGQKAYASFPYLPGQVWKGTVDYIYPRLDPKTHTLRLRLVFPNPQYVLKPNMYANVKIMGTPIKNVIAIPRSSLIRTGAGDRVILSLGKGRYKPQAVKIGIESGNYYQVLSGLKVGDRVVISAQFLIDSESNIKASFDRMTDHHH